MPMGNDGAEHRETQEVAAIDLICESCGEANRPGSQFCVSCNSFLAWDRSMVARPDQPTPQPGHGTPYVAADQQPGPVQPQYPANPQYPAADSPSPATPHDPQEHYPQDASWYEVPQPTGGTTPDPGWGAYSASTCPSCGLQNTPDRRFCARCGYGFASSMPAALSANAGQGFQGAAAQARAARKAYRRSLPPLYRWRRVIIGVLVAALAAAGFAVAGRDPIGVAKGGWYSLNKRYVKVTPVQASVDPADATAAGSDVAALVDSSVREWTMNWQPSVSSSCGGAASTDTIVLTFVPTRVRRIQILPGLDKSNPQRLLQPLPETIGITFDDGVCHPFTLTKKEEQLLKVDSLTPTSSVRIAIGSVFPSGPDAPPLVSITEIVVQAFPS